MGDKTDIKSGQCLRCDRIISSVQEDTLTKMYESQGVLLHFLKSAGDVEVSIHNNFDESEGFDCLNHACV